MMTGLHPGLVASASFVLTAFLLSISTLKSSIPLLLTERFWPESGPVEIAFLSIYAACLTLLMLSKKKSSPIRLWMWRLFSFVFFLQLFLGLLGFSSFLMTGKLHLPIPALILAGPIYRGEGFFMLILFLCTVLLVGPAWCSHLCYIGAWDDIASRTQKRPTPLPRWKTVLRILIALLVVLVAALLSFLGLGSSIAFYLAFGFGVLGLLAMLIFSRRTGTMVHCTVYCPVGLLANLLGRFHPFSIRIGKQCTRCMKCQSACRYEALSKHNIEDYKPGFTCSLCGDCIEACPHGQIHYHFGGLHSDGARKLFIVLAVSLHATFLGLARI